MKTLLERPQIDLPLNVAADSRRKLVTLDVAMDRLDLDTHDEVLAAIDTGAIAWAWDISSPGAERREVRVFWRCTREGEIRSSQHLTEDAVYREIIPAHWGRVRQASIYRRWTCSQEHITALITAGCFTALTEARAGADGSPEVTRESVIQFLKTRKL